FAGPLPAGVVHEQPPHGLPGGGQEVGPAGEVRAGGQAEVRLVDEGGRLEGVSGRRGSEGRRGEGPQLGGDEGEEIVRTCCVSRVGARTKVGHVGRVYAGTMSRPTAKGRSQQLPPHGRHRLHRTFTSSPPWTWPPGRRSASAGGDTGTRSSSSSWP